MWSIRSNNPKARIREVNSNKWAHRRKGIDIKLQWVIIIRKGKFKRWINENETGFSEVK